jgi:aconitase A
MEFQQMKQGGAFMPSKDHFSLARTLESGGKTYRYYHLNSLEQQGLGDISSLPFSIKVLLEAAVRQYDGRAITEEQGNSFYPRPDRTAGLHRRTGSC